MGGPANDRPPIANDIGKEMLDEHFRKDQAESHRQHDEDGRRAVRDGSVDAVADASRQATSAPVSTLPPASEIVAQRAAWASMPIIVRSACGTKRSAVI